MYGAEESTRVSGMIQSNECRGVLLKPLLGDHRLYLGSSSGSKMYEDTTSPLCIFYALQKA